MNERKGIQELKEMMAFVVALISAVGDSMEDGKISFMDLFKFFGAFRKAAPAFKGMAEMRAEIKDLSEDEKKELSAYVAKELELEDKLVESYIEQALSLAISLLDLLPLAMKK